MSSRLSWNIIKQFSCNNVYGFTHQDVVREFPERNPAYLARLLADMVGAGMLCRIPRKKFHIIPLNADPETYVPDGYQLAKYMMLNEAYYIGYASALKIHGLSPLSIHREYVVTKKQKKPAIISFGGISYQFVQHNACRFFGLSSIWINQFEKAMVSNLEKTIVDMATNPSLCRGIVELGNALFRARDRTDQDKLFYYFARNMNMAAKKRFLFLTDLLGLKWMAEHDRMMEELGPGNSILDPAEPNLGERRSRFGLKVNVDPNLIKKKVFQKG